MEEYGSRVLAESAGLAQSLGAVLLDPRAVAGQSARGPDIPLDVGVCGLFSLCFFVLNWTLRLLVIEPSIRAFTRVKPHQVRKMAQSVMEACLYGTFTAVGLLLIPTAPWAWPSDLWWQCFQHGTCDVMTSSLRCYYVLYAARYLQMSASLCLEPKRADFVNMAVHHLATVFLIFLSYLWNWTRVGAVVMVIMDPADVPLHLAKVCKYTAESKKKRCAWHFWTSRFFELFGFSFFVTRILMFSYVCWSILVEGSRYIPNFGGVAGRVGIALCFVLLILQILWFRLILKVVARMLRGQDPDDVRSDDEDEATAAASSAAARKGKRGWGPLVVGLLSACLALAELRAIASRWETTSSDVQAYLGSLAVVWTGPAAAVAQLPAGPPDLPRDRCVFSVFALVIFVLNWGVRLILVEPFAKKAVKLKGNQVAKFAQSVMEVAIYGGFTILGLLVVPSQEFVWPSWKWWRGFSEGGHDVMRLDLRCYYLLYVARYSQALVSVLFEAKRKDFAEMLIHHIVTIVIIYVSYVYGWNRVGVVVMALLDPADVPLHLAKLCKYTAESTKKHLWQFLADRLFEVFGVTFFVTRIICYGYVCWSAHIEATRYFPKGVPEWTCVVLLYTLLVLQCYWFSLIVKVAMKLFAGKSVEDIRSDDEDEGTPSTKKKQ